MTKTIYGLALALVLGTTGALAEGNNNTGGDSCRGNCPQEGGSGPVDVSQRQAQGQLQSQESYNANLNHNESNSSASAGAISGSQSDSTSTATGGDATVLVGVGVHTGGASSRSGSHSEGGDGGDATATGGAGGDSSSRSEVGDTTAISGPSLSSASNGGNSTGDVGVSIADNSSYSIEYQQASARAASVYSQVCQNGGSAQGFKGGFGVNNSDVLCDHLKTASVMREAYMFELQYGVFEECESDEHDTHTVHCTNEKAQHYYEAYHESMDDAIKLMDQVEEAGMMDKFMGYLIRPAALIGALVWLI